MAIINIIYKIRAIIMTKRLTPYMNLLTKETQIAYKQGRSSVDVLPLVRHLLKFNEARQLILIDLSESFDSINRNTIWTVLYEKGIPWEMIARLRMCHMGNKLCPKYRGAMGKYIYKNKGVFQGIPIRAMLFIIYFDDIMAKYERK